MKEIRPSGKERRDFLATTGGLVCLSGCSASAAFSSKQLPRIGELSLRNESANQHTLHVVVSRDDSIVRWSSHTLEGLSDEKDASTETTIKGQEWMQTPGKWVVAVRVEDGESWKEIALNRSEVPCKVVDITYDEKDPPAHKLDLHVSAC